MCDTLPVHISGYRSGKGVYVAPLTVNCLAYNVPHSVDSLLKKRHPNDTLNRDLFCRQ